MSRVRHFFVSLRRIYGGSYKGGSNDIRRKVVPRAGIEPALLSEPDFESGASTNSANGALR